MKLDFETLQLAGFRSFVQPTTFTLAKPAGLYFIRGKNELEPELEGNGVGKSTLFEAVYWCLFGKTTNGVTAGNISTWGSDKADVTVGLKVNDKAVTIRRARGPNRLQIDGKDVTQDRVIAILGITPDLVSSAVLIGQFADTFVEKGHAERLAMFSQLLSLDRWDTYSESAKANATHYEQQVRELEAQLSHNQGMREGMNPKQLEKAATDWEASRTGNLRSVEETVARTALTLQTVQEELNEKNTELKLLKEVPLPGVFYSPDKPEAEANPALDVVRNDAQLLTHAIQIKRYEETNLKKKVQEINELGAICSQCGQAVTGEHKEMECAKLLDGLKRILAEVTELENELKNKKSLINQMVAEDTNLYLQAVALWQKDCARIKEAAQIAHVQYQKYTAALALIMQAVGNCKMKYLNAMKSQQEATKRLESIRSEVNPFMTQISKMKADIEKIDLKIKKLGENVTETKHLLAELQYWVGGFKKLKLLIVEESLRTLEMAVNDAVVQLGLHGWVIKLDAERELTTGAIKREFVIYVQSPYNEEAVPWESWSGGERQRLRLAMIFGLQTFMQQRTGVTTNLMFLDEPTNWLSNAGVESMLSFLKDKAARDNLAIWLADHRSLDSGEFSHTFLIRKTENGSIIEG